MIRFGVCIQPGLTLVAAIALAVACVEGVEPATTLWNGTLAPVDTDDPTGISGSVAALSEGGRSELSISIQNADPDSAYAWDVRAANCVGTGSVLAGPAVYPTLEPDLDGTATADAIVSEEMNRGESYSAHVHHAETSVELACADLELGDDS